MAQEQQAPEDAVDLDELREVIVSIIGLAVLHERATDAGDEMTEAEREDAKYLGRLIREHDKHLGRAPLLRSKKGHLFTQLDAELLPQAERVKAMLDFALTSDDTDDEVLSVVMKHLGENVAPATTERVERIKGLLVDAWLPAAPRGGAKPTNGFQGDLSSNLREWVRSVGGASHAAHELVTEWTGWADATGEWKKQRSGSALKQATAVLRQGLGPEARPDQSETKARRGVATGGDVLDYLLTALDTPPEQAAELMKMVRTFAAEPEV